MRLSIDPGVDTPTFTFIEYIEHKTTNNYVLNCSRELCDYKTTKN